MRVNIPKTIEQSLLQLINTRRLDDITIQSLCEQADVSKTSFYKYYKDKYDLVNKVFDRIMPEGLDQIGRNIRFSEALNLVFDALGKERPFLRQAYYSDDFNNLENHTVDYLVSLLSQLIQNKNGTLTDQVIFSCHFFAVSLARFIREWVQKGGNDTKENLIQAILKSAPWSISTYFN